MAFRIDLHDPVTGNKTGKTSILTASQVTETRALSRIGKWSFPMSVADGAYPEIEGKDFKIYWENRGQSYLLGQASYLNHKLSATGQTVTVNAAGGLRELSRETTLQRSFDGATADVNHVLAEIVPLRSGWSLGDVDTITTPAPMDFWYETIFDGVSIIAQTFGYHFREGRIPETLDFGVFGASSGVEAIGGKGLTIHPEIYSNANVCKITSLDIDYQSDVVVNSLIPFGGALGVATISLGEADTFQPGHPRNEALLPDGTKYYYIRDTDSMNRWGLTERRFLRKDLRPISNTPDSRKFAANVLYEATLASLLNLRDRQVVYSLAVTGLTPGSVREGDKIRVRYQGVSQTRYGTAEWLDLDDEFYILEMSHTYGAGASTTLKINKNAVHEETTEDLLANTIRAFEQSRIHPQPTTNTYTVGPYEKGAAAATVDDPEVRAKFSITFGVETLAFYYCFITLTGGPLKGNVKSVQLSETTSGPSNDETGGPSNNETGGPSNNETGDDEQIHGHPWSIIDDPNADTGVPLYLKNASVVANYGTNVNINGGPSFAPHSHNNPHTHDNPHRHDNPHTHDMPEIQTVFGFFEEDALPDTVTVRLNGIVIASDIALGDGKYTIDISSHLLAETTLQKEHIIEVQCTQGRGLIQFEAQVANSIQPITLN